MNPVELVSKLMSLDTASKRQWTGRRLIVKKTESLKDSDAVLKNLRSVAPSTSEGWFVCALTPSARMLKDAAGEQESPMDWISTARFPTSGEGFSKGNNTSWHFIHLGGSTWQWTEWGSEEANDSITVIDALVNLDGSPMSYEICYSPVDLGSHTELRPTAQRFIGFKTSLPK